MTIEEVKELIMNNDLTIELVIDATIELNGIIGVGKISLGNHLKEYCFNHIERQEQKSSDEIPF